MAYKKPIKVIPSGKIEINNQDHINFMVSTLLKKKLNVDSKFVMSIN
jgi:phage-related protein